MTISHYKSRYAHIYMSLYVISSIYYYKYVPIIYMSYITISLYQLYITTLPSLILLVFFLIAIYHHVIIQVMYNYITHISPIYHPFITHKSPIYHHRFFRSWSSSPSWAAAAVNSSWHVRCVALGSCCRCRRSSPCAPAGDDFPGVTMGFPCSSGHGC